MPRNRSAWIAAFVVTAVVVVAGVAYTVYRRVGPAPHSATDEEHFLYGSVGNEANGVPYWIWLVLPRIFPEYLPGPGGYASLGILTQDGREMPVGLSKVTVGVPRVGINCAFCHTTSVRTSPDGPRMLVPGGPSNRTSVQGYRRFLMEAAADPRFTASVILREIARNYRLSALERAFYRFVVIPETRERLLEMKQQSEWMDRHPDWGAGRADALNSAKFGPLRQPADETIGSADMPSLWALGTRRPYLWDGLNTDLREVVVSSALVDGATLDWVNRDMLKWDAEEAEERSSLRRVMDYIGQLRPPKYPLPIDAALAARGAGVFEAECGACHAPGGARTGTVIPLAELGTDRLRLESWTRAAADAYNDYGEGRAWKFSHFRTTQGYVAVPLDGIWLRAPYLHNGSVPTIADLLQPPDARPTRFWRGYDLLDGEKLGFVSEGAEAERMGTLYDTSLPGNGNGGHAFGTTLPPESKRALIEYLKTL